MRIQIRPARVEDAPALLALRYRLFEETDYMLWEPEEYREVVTEEDEAGLIARCADSPRRRLLVATRDGVLIGCLIAMGEDRQRLLHTCRLALGVVREHWSHGVGSMLMSEIIHWARAAGLGRLELTVRTSNVRAIHLYLRHGFELEGRRRASLRLKSGDVNEYGMALILNQQAA